MNRLLFALGVAALAASPLLAAAGKIPDGLSYTRPLAGGRVFVVHGDAAAEAKSTSPAEFAALRAKYPRPGLYHNDTLVYALDGPFAPSDAVFLTADGRHLVRLDGEWWREKDFPGRNRLPADVEERQLDAPALSFFADGVLVKQHRLRDVATKPEKLPHSPHYVLWVAGPVLSEPTGRFLLPTQDSFRQVYDVATGELLERKAVGLANPLTVPILVAAGAMAAGIVGLWAWLVFVKWKPAV